MDLKHLGYLPQAEELPDQVTGYLADHLAMTIAVELGAQRRQARYRYQKAFETSSA